MALVDTIIAKWEAAQAEANRRNEERYRQALEEYDKIIQMYSPGGAFGKGFEAQLERGRIKSLAQGTQALVSSGLYGTTMQAGLGKKFEEEVATPARLQMEDIRMQRLAGARQARAGLIERREDVAPSYALMAQLVQQAGRGRRRIVGSLASRTSGPSLMDQYRAHDEFWRSKRSTSSSSGGYSGYGYGRSSSSSYGRSSSSSYGRGVGYYGKSEVLPGVWGATKSTPTAPSYLKRPQTKKVTKAVSSILYSPWM